MYMLFNDILPALSERIIEIHYRIFIYIPVPDNNIIIQHMYSLDSFGCIIKLKSSINTVHYPYFRVCI